MRTTYLAEKPYVTISGEIGAVPQGTKTLIVRFAGCNLNCPYCDSEHSIKINPDKHILVDNPVKLGREIDDLLYHNGVRHILITGGEPLLHAEFFERVLWASVAPQEGMFITVETNGSIPPGCFSNAWTLDICKAFVVDVKLHLLRNILPHPDNSFYMSQSIEATTYMESLKAWGMLRKKVYFKVICEFMEDVDFGIKVIQEVLGSNLCEVGGIYFAPVVGDMEECDPEDRETTRSILNMIKHKLIDNNPFNKVEKYVDRMPIIGINTQLHKFLAMP